MAGEASGSRQKRQRLVEEEEGENGGGGDVATRRYGTLYELDLLDCPICCHALSRLIFQCDNGHIACSSCCISMRNKCPSCTLPIGINRSRIMERVVAAVIVPCPNAKHGCTEMVQETNQALAGEASGSCQKRQRVPSIVGEEGENGGEDVVVRVGTLLELDLLDCPVCCGALKTCIFQCDNGHIACSSCCTKLRHKCPSCTLPIGNYRSRIMEKVVAAVIVSCSNAKHGCTKTFSYGKELIHEKKCSFTLCYCPAPNCNYSGVYKDLYSHYAANHNKHKYRDKSFSYGFSYPTGVDTDKKISVLQECLGGPLVVIQYFKEPQGLYFTVNCIAPSAPGVGKLSYDLSYNSYYTSGNTLTFTSPEMNRIQKVSFQTPEKDFMLVPDYLLSRMDLAKVMRICIRRLEEKEEEAEEESEEEEEEEVEEEEQEEEAEEEEDED